MAASPTDHDGARAPGPVPSEPDFDWRQVLEHSPDMIMIVGRDGTIHYMNRVVPGFAVEDVVGSSAYEYVPPEAREQMRGLIEQVIDSGEPVNYEISGAGPDGGEAWYFSSMSPVLRGTEVIAATIITRDITDRRRLEEATRDAYEHERAAVRRLRELDELKGEFVAKVVHDLRTPITVIDGFAQTLADGWERFDDDRRREFVDLMRFSAARLTALVRDILDVSRIEAAEFSYDVEPLDVREAVEQGIASMGGLAWRVDLDVDDDLPPMLADRLRHEQVLVNLLTNAVKFSPERSRILVTARRSGEHVAIGVRDHGVGIAPGDVPRLFQRFSQLQREDLATPEGSGLGLYICRTMLEAQGGSIAVESTVGEGSTFTYRLPAAQVAGG